MRVFAGFCAVSALFHTGNSLPVDYSQWESIDHDAPVEKAEVADTLDHTSSTSEESSVEKRFWILGGMYAGMLSIISIPFWLPWVLLKDKKKQEEAGSVKRNTIYQQEKEQDWVALEPEEHLLASEDRSEKRFWGTILSHIVAGAIMAPIAIGVLGLPGWLLLGKSKQEEKERQQAQIQGKRSLSLKEEEDKEPTLDPRGIFEMFRRARKIAKESIAEAKMRGGGPFWLPKTPKAADSVFLKRQSDIVSLEDLEYQITEGLNSLEAIVNSTQPGDIRARAAALYDLDQETEQQDLSTLLARFLAVDEHDVLEVLTEMNITSWDQLKESDWETEQPDSPDLSKRFIWNIVHGLILLFAAVFGVAIPMAVQVKRDLGNRTEENDLTDPETDGEVSDDAEPQKRFLAWLLTGIVVALASITGLTFGLAHTGKHLSAVKDRARQTTIEKRQDTDATVEPNLQTLSAWKRDLEEMVSDEETDMPDSTHVSPRFIGAFLSLLGIVGAMVSVMCIPKPGQKSPCHPSHYKRDVEEMST
jgi:hypothetical protein